MALAQKGCVSAVAGCTQVRAPFAGGTAGQFLELNLWVQGCQNGPCVSGEKPRVKIRLSRGVRIPGNSFRTKPCANLEAWIGTNLQEQTVISRNPFSPS